VPTGKGRVFVNVDEFKFDQCEMPGKQLVEGFCLSYDLLRGCCLETQGACHADPQVTENEE
jgi:hypothetical protein